MPDTSPQLVHAVAQETVDVLASYPNLKINACILGTRVFTAACGFLKIKTAPLPTQAMAMNEEAVALIEKGIPADKWPSTAWSVGTHPGSNGDGYKGHLVAKVMNVQGHGEIVVDTTAVQFSRPEKGISIPRNAVLVDIPKDDRSGTSAKLPDNSVILYRFTHDTSYLMAPDWMSQQHLGLAHEVIAQVLQVKGLTPREPSSFGT